VTERNLLARDERSGERGREVGGAVIGNTANPSMMPNVERSQWQYCHNAPEASRPRSPLAGTMPNGYTADVNGSQ